MNATHCTVFPITPNQSNNKKQKKNEYKNQTPGAKHGTNIQVIKA